MIENASLSSSLFGSVSLDFLDTMSPTPPGEREDSFCSVLKQRDDSKRFLTFPVDDIFSFDDT